MPQAKRRMSNTSEVVSVGSRPFLERFNSDNVSLESLNVQNQFNETDLWGIAHPLFKFSMQLGMGVKIDGEAIGILVDIVQSKRDKAYAFLIQRCYNEASLRSLGIRSSTLPPLARDQVMVSDLFEVLTFERVTGECRLVTEEQFKFFHPPHSK